MRLLALEVVSHEIDELTFSHRTRSPRREIYHQTDLKDSQR
jgi:hypothetical protein